MALEAAGNRSAEAVPERIARELRAAIDAGQYPPGMLLPSEKTIGIELGASGPTVREGLASLARKAASDPSPAGAASSKSRPCPGT
jgi:DNA-binding FadR family transcriptional regulator